MTNDTLTESDIKRVYIYPINLGVSKKFSDKGFVNITIDSILGTHCVCFDIEADIIYYADSFVGVSDISLLIQLPKKKFLKSIKFKIKILDYIDLIL